MLFVKPTYNTFIFGKKGVDNEKENNKTHQNIYKKCVTWSLLIFANGFILEFQNQRKS